MSVNFVLLYCNVFVVAIKVFLVAAKYLLLSFGKILKATTCHLGTCCQYTSISFKIEVLLDL